MSATKRTSGQNADGLTKLQIKAAQLLAAGMSDPQVAELLQVDRSTVYRWRTTNLVFVGELGALRRAVWSAAADRLRGLTGRALDVIEKHLDDPKLALRAAAILLRQAAPRGRELVPEKDVNLNEMIDAVTNEHAMLASGTYPRQHEDPPNGASNAPPS